MARYRDSVCRLCRREGEKLFLKGERCHTDKCAIDRREYPPGQHGQARKKPTDYATQLREKQKVKRIYGVLERQFRGYFHEADRRKGVTGHNLIQLLEVRLDNMVFRMGFAASRSEARQLVAHRHVTVNGRTVNKPSFLVKAGDVVAVREKSRSIAKIGAALEAAERRGFPAWVDVNKGHFSGTLKQLPVRDDITSPMNEQLIVELYSK